MRKPVLLLTALCVPTWLGAQEMPLRVEAIQLLERANKVSLISGAPDLRLNVTFRAYGVDGKRSEGTYNRILTKDGQYVETNYGEIHGRTVFMKAEILQSAYFPPPPELSEMTSLVPVKLVRFDGSDIIHSIEVANLSGRAAKCIRFDTTTGRSSQSNEICVDAQRGTLLRLQLGESAIENSDYVEVAGTWFPRVIRHYLEGQLRMEIEQEASEIAGTVDLLALAPPNPTILHRCANFRRAIGKSMPQPPNAGSGPWFDVEVRGVVYGDGKVRDTTVLPQGNPNLEAEAIRIVSSWEFDPPTCDGKPATQIMTFVVHFPPR